MAEWGLAKARKKQSAPNNTIVWLVVQFEINSMQMSIPRATIKDEIPWKLLKVERSFNNPGGRFYLPSTRMQFWYILSEWSGGIETYRN